MPSDTHPGADSFRRPRVSGTAPATLRVHPHGTAGIPDCHVVESRIGLFRREQINVGVFRNSCSCSYERISIADLGAMGKVWMTEFMLALESLGKQAVAVLYGDEAKWARFAGPARAGFAQLQHLSSLCGTQVGEPGIDLVTPSLKGSSPRP